MPFDDDGAGLGDPRGGDELEAVLVRVDVERALAPLSPDERRLVELRYAEDLTQPAAAAALGVPEGTVKVRLHQLRARLRQTLTG